MRMMIQQRARLGAAVLAALGAGLCIGTAATAAPQQGTATVQAPRRALLLFPVDVTATGVPTQAKDEASALMTDVAASRLSASGAYTVTRFSPALPTVARLRIDQLITDADVQAPFSADNRKPIKIGKEAGYDVVFVGSVDSYEYNDTDRQVTLVASGRLIEVQTGKVLRSAVINGASPKGGTAKEEELALAAARAAGEQLMTKLVPVIVAPTTATTPTKVAPANQGTGRKRARMDWLWGVLAVGLGLGIGLSSGSDHNGGGGGGGGTGGDGPPPPP